MCIANEECFISVDVETAGPDPSRYALLSIGACLVSNPVHGFYVELQPTSMNATEEALAVSGLSLEELSERGIPAAEGMRRFAAWLQEVAHPDGVPVLVAFNAPFDWMFVNSYFHRYLGRNPFGHAALDMKAFFMGLAGSAWADTAMDRVARRLGCEIHLSHHALEDARNQAHLFRRMLKEASASGPARYEEPDARENPTWPSENRRPQSRI